MIHGGWFFFVKQKWEKDDRSLKIIRELGNFILPRPFLMRDAVPAAKDVLGFICIL